MMLPGTGAHASVDEPGAYGIVYVHDGGVVVHTEDVNVAGRRTLSYV